MYIGHPLHSLVNYLSGYSIKTFGLGTYLQKRHRMEGTWPCHKVGWVKHPHPNTRAAARDAAGACGELWRGQAAPLSEGSPELHVDLAQHPLPAGRQQADWLVFGERSISFQFTWQEHYLSRETVENEGNHCFAFCSLSSFHFSPFQE